MSVEWLRGVDVLNTIMLFVFGGGQLALPTAAALCAPLPLRLVQRTTCVESLKLSEKFAELQAGLVSGTSMHGRLAHRPGRVWRSLRQRASGVGQKTA